MMRGWPKNAKFAAQVNGTQAAGDTSIQFLPNQFNVLGQRLRTIDLSLNEQGTSDATNILTNITRVSLFAGGQKLWDAPTSHYQALFGWMGKKAAWVGGQFYVQLPLHMWRGYSAPPGQQLSLTLTKNATFATNRVPTINMHLGYNDEDVSKGYTYIIAQKYNVPATSNGFGINPSTPGVLQYVILPTLTGVTGLTFYDKSGQVMKFIDVHALTAHQEWFSGVAYAAPYSGPFVFKVPVERALKSGVTQVEVATSGWTDDEITLVTLFPNDQAQGKK